MKNIVDYFKRVIGGFLKNNCSMHAAGLTYFSMLGLVPILCIVLVTAKACSVDDYAQNYINSYLDTMISNIEHGQDEEVAFISAVNDEEREKKRIAAEEFAHEARKISNSIFERIAKFDAKTLGWIGFGFLLWTVISSIGMVEVSFNGIWDVPKARPIWKRALLYLLIAVVLPIFAAVGFSVPVMGIVKDILASTIGATTLTKWVSDGLIWFLDSFIFRSAVMLGTATMSFAFFFWVIPNCKVYFRHAIYGGLVTALLFGTWLKVCAIAQVGIAKSSALYGSFAFFPIVLAWMYMSWEIILLGANMVKAFDVDGEGKTR